MISTDLTAAVARARIQDLLHEAGSARKVNRSDRR